MRNPTDRATGLGAALAGMLLIAATYGMARFGVGLFAPALEQERPQLAGVLGWAAAAQFSAYCVAASVAAGLVDRHPRAGLLLAGATATAGCVGVALADQPGLFVLAVLVGGMGGGFASPALVPVIDALVPRRLSATAQSLVNAGTAVGVIGAGLTAFAVPSVGAAWLAMALICAAATAAAWFPVRARTDLGTASRGRRKEDAGEGDAREGEAHTGLRRIGKRLTGLQRTGKWRGLALPAGAAVVVGGGSALIWTFGPLLLTEAGAIAEDRTGWLWIALGAGGLLGTLAGVLVARAGLRSGWLMTSGALAAAVAATALAAATGNPWPAVAGMAIFGAAYMGLSAVLILWAREVFPNAAGAGTSVLFIALATGQAAGSALFGLAMDAVPAAVLAAAAAGLCLAGGLLPALPAARKQRSVPVPG